jgi:hypothetical protein
MDEFSPFRWRGLSAAGLCSGAPAGMTSAESQTTSECLGRWSSVTCGSATQTEVAIAGQAKLQLVHGAEG